jgi:hypothetical protein
MKVWIDGALQIPLSPLRDGRREPVEIGKGKEDDAWKRAPPVPNWDQEREEAVRWEGLPPLKGRKDKERVVFTNVTKVWSRNIGGKPHDMWPTDALQGDRVDVLVEKGIISCVGSCASQIQDAKAINLQGGMIYPGLMSYGSSIGLAEIEGELSTTDGLLHDALKRDIPRIMQDVGGLVRASDGLIFQTRNAL